MGKKKNKKSFAENLELLFEERMVNDNAQDNISMIEDDTVSKESGSKKPASKKKSFSNNLEQFFKDSIDGVLDGVINDKKSDRNESENKAIGLDLLIRKTTSENIHIKVENTKPKTQRVTVFMDSSKLDALKKIAKQENRRLQQIIRELVAEYLTDSDNCD